MSRIGLTSALRFVGIPVVPIALALFSAFPMGLGAQRAIEVPAEVYAGRRAALFQQGGSLPVVVPGSDLVRSGGTGKQDLNFWYLTGVESPFAVLLIEPDGTADGRSVLFLPDTFQFAGAQYSIPDSRFRRAAWNRTFRALAPGADAARQAGFDAVLPIDDFAQTLTEAIDASQTVNLVDGEGTRYAPPGMPTPRTVRGQFLDGVRELLGGARTYTDVAPLVERMRLVKDAHEIEALREAARVSSLSFIEAMSAIKPGANDLEIAGLMEYVWKREGASRAAFSPIVASGASSVSLYTLRSELYNSTDRVMQAGELVFIDYGAAEFDMYASDVCRTFPVSGRFTDEQRRYYGIVLEALETALDEIRPGAMMIDVIRAAAQVFKKHGLDQYEDIEVMGVERVWGLMPSPTYWIDQDGPLTDYSGARGSGVRDLGHHIGLDALDSRDYTVPLDAGMVFTVEPKIYIPELDLAIMIEDMILVTANGYENLSALAPKSVEAIERAMAR